MMTDTHLIMPLVDIKARPDGRHLAIITDSDTGRELASKEFIDRIGLRSWLAEQLRNRPWEPNP